MHDTGPAEKQRGEIGPERRDGRLPSLRSTSVGSRDTRENVTIRASPCTLCIYTTLRVEARRASDTGVPTLGWQSACEQEADYSCKLQ